MYEIIAKMSIKSAVILKVLFNPSEWIGEWLKQSDNKIIWLQSSLVPTLRID
jgi:hypothetical protein